MMELYPYQYNAVSWIIDNRYCGLFLEMGLGKTVITLTAIQELIYERMEVDRVLVVAPLRVANTVWAEEAAKWEHLKRLKCVKLTGCLEQRVKRLREQADVYIINRELLCWLIERTKGNWPFDMVVLDELSSFKSAKSARFKFFRRVRPQVKRVVGLTGTPAPNGLLDLWPQLYLIDRGARLGQTLTGFRDRYFLPGRRNGQIVYDWVPKPEAQQAITRAISDICMSMRARDYVALPDRIDQTVRVELPESTARTYKQLERELVLSLAGTTITAASAAVVTGKLLQMANGGIYDEEHKPHTLHKAKLDALEDLIEQAAGEPVLVYYGFRFDVDMIRERIPEARVLETEQDITDWNAGRIPVLLAHPDSAGHGLNLQHGGHILIWYGLTWSLEKYQQACARLHRNGQHLPVRVYHIVAKGTIDEDVMRVLERKETRQNAVLEAVRARL